MGAIVKGALKVIGVGAGTGGAVYAGEKAWKKWF